MPSGQGNMNIMVEALTLGLPTPMAQRRGTASLRALSTPRPGHRFRTSFLSTHCAQALPPFHREVPRTLPFWSIYLG